MPDRLPATPAGSNGRSASRAESAADTPWHAEPWADVLATQGTDADGISDSEARERLQRHGPNELPQGRRRGPLRRLLLQFHNRLIYVLIGAAALSLLLGHIVDMAVIIAVVTFNAVIGFVQEGRAERALDAIRRMLDPLANVRRNGRRHTVPANEIVPGDIVLLEAGDRVPADLRLIRARNLKIEEAVLTGESVAVDKATEAVEIAVPLGERTSMAYSGTFVAAGQGHGVVVETGARTELGRVSTLIGSVEALRTPLVRQIDDFAKQLVLVILGVALLAFLFARFVRDYPLQDALMAVVGLAVSAIPEGLPAIMTITLAIGVQRMAARRAVIRQLAAVETLGSISVICSDKTGTLTRNEMTVRAVIAADAEYETTGVGYAPEGAIRHDDRQVVATDIPALIELVRGGLLCNDAELRQIEGHWVVNGDPMEGALVTLAHKAGLDPAAERKTFARADEIPFDSQHRFMATLHRPPDSGPFALIKGAPERVVDMCSLERHDGTDRPIDRDAWQRRAHGLAEKGQRVLAIATKPLGDSQEHLTFQDVEENAVLLGFVGLLDPPREEAIDAIRDCRSAGIRVVMITGDHLVTAREIARQLGIAENPRALSGQDLDGLDEPAMRKAAAETDVFARTTPENKLRLVQALQDDGFRVAMTGDGVNDAPALKRADVGVAMGMKGTEAAKEAAEVVLADDNFASIVSAVREGRTVYDNLMKTIAWTLPTSAGEALTIIAAIALGLALPITPVQILWINMVTAPILGLTLAFEATEPGTMRRPPRPPEQPVLTRELLWRIAFVSALVVCFAFGMFFWAEQRGLPIETARTLVVNTIVVMEIFYLFSVRYVHGTSLTWRGVLGTPAVLIAIAAIVVAQSAFTYFPPLQAIFDTRPLSPVDGALAIACGVTLLFLAEAEKAVRNRLFASRTARG